MKIYNQDKTAELAENEINYELGYLTDDRILVAHHTTVPFSKGKSATEKAGELQSQGKTVETINGKPYFVDKVYENGGKEVAEITADPDTEAKEAYDEYEDVKVYIPYNADDLSKCKLGRLRNKREPLLEAFDKWEKAVLRGRESDDIEVMRWYRDLLDLKEGAFESVPDKVAYYQKSREVK